MLYILHKGNHEGLDYHGGGQEPIVHLEADLHSTIAWANRTGKRWAFTTSNAGSHYFEDYANLADLDKVDWAAVQARQWSRCREGKQAEFLVEGCFPWDLVRRVGVFDNARRQQVVRVLQQYG